MPYPMLPYMGLMHTALGAELSDFMQGKESAEQALQDVEAAYIAAANEKGFLYALNSPGAYVARPAHARSLIWTDRDET